MAGGASIASGFGGFGKGLANALLLNRERQDQLRREDQAKKDREFQSKLPVYMRIWEETGDPSPVEGLYAEHFGMKIPPKGSGFRALGPALLGKGSQQAPQDRTMMEQEQDSALAAGNPTAQPMLPNRAQPGQGALQPARKTLFGVELPTPEERAARISQLEAAQLQAEVNARNKVGGTQGLSGTALQDYSLYGTRPPLAASQFGSVPQIGSAGDYVMRKIQEAQAAGQPVTTEQIAQWRTEAAEQTDPMSLGQYAERASIELGFGRASQVRDPVQMRQINERAIALQAEAAGQTTTARGAANADVPLTPQQRFTATMALQDDWRRAEAPQREMQRQLQIMDIGMRRFEGLQADGTPDPAGPDRVGGSEAVRVTYEKILDPTSVVREGEYARQGTGLSLLQRMEAFYQRYGTGGGEIPPAVLKGMVETARQFVAGLENWNTLERQRISETATSFGLDPARVFGVAAAADRLEQQRNGAGTGTATPPPMTPGKPYQDAQGNWVIP